MDSIFAFPTYLTLAFDVTLWYNEIMSTEIISAPDIQTSIKRIVADSLARQAELEVPYAPNADAKIKNRDILATILWDLVTLNEAVLADGRKIIPESYSDWLATVKYLVTHLDGPVGGEEGMGTNVFKVYVGVNIDKV